MKKYIAIAFAALALSSCQSLIEEWQPVFTGKYDEPAAEKAWTKSEVESEYGSIITIAELAAKYQQGKPMDIKEKLVISGVVSTTDKPGNFYKSLFIQDETGGIEVKVGKNALYNDYLPGQRLYIVCNNGLTLGMYGFKTGNYGGMGMVQLGGSRNLNDDGTPSDEYETSYIENQVVINRTILKGEFEGVVKGTPITESQLPDTQKDTQKSNQYIGKLVTLKGLKYADQTFVLLYLDSNKDKKSYTNRVFLSDSNGANGSDLTHGITTWAMSKEKMTELLTKGLWDACKVGSGADFVTDAQGHEVTLGDLKGENGDYPTVEKAAYSVSQYFKMGSTDIQVRTSGFCKFADKEIPAEVLSKAKTIDVTGILNLYQGSIQLTVNDISDFVVDGVALK